MGGGRIAPQPHRAPDAEGHFLGRKDGEPRASGAFENIEHAQISREEKPRSTKHRHGR